MKVTFALLIWAAAALSQPKPLPSTWSAHDKERALGEQLAAEFARQAALVNDPAIAGYVQHLAERLSAGCATGRSIDARAIASDERNGFALPGGFIFVNTGLIRNADSEGELAGVLAFLIAQSLNNAGIPLIFMGGWTGYSYKPGAGGVAIPIGFASAYRAAVSQADLRGLRCLWQAGYDPETFITGLKKVEAEERSDGNATSRPATHPPAAERIATAEAAIPDLAPKPQYVLSTRGFNEVRARLARLYPARPSRLGPPPSLRR